jgi:hypothetical protein
LRVMAVVKMIKNMTMFEKNTPMPASIFLADLSLN